MIYQIYCKLNANYVPLKLEFIMAIFIISYHMNWHKLQYQHRQSRSMSIHDHKTTKTDRIIVCFA